MPSVTWSIVYRVSTGSGRSEATVASEALVLALVRSPEVRALLEPLGVRPDALEADLAARRAPPLRPDEPLRLDDLTEHMDLARIVDAANGALQFSIIGGDEDVAKWPEYLD